MFKSPEGRTENSPGLQAWEGLQNENRPERAADCRALFPKKTFVESKSIGVSESYESLPGTKVQGDVRPDCQCRRYQLPPSTGMAIKVFSNIRVDFDPNFLRMRERSPIFRREDRMHN
jgi:hypothetical protein